MSFENHVYHEHDDIRQRQAGYVGQPAVEMQSQNESACGYGGPFVVVHVNGVQYDKVWAYIDKEKGADGGWYNVIKFRRDNPAPTTND